MEREILAAAMAAVSDIRAVAQIIVAYILL